MTPYVPVARALRGSVLEMVIAAALLSACASGPPPPDWQVNARDASEQAVAAYLAGNTRVETLAWERARSELARTGQAVQMARAELLRCATRVASLVFEDCAAFEALRADVPAAQRAYADYLAGRLAPQDVAVLAAQHQAAARAAGAATAADVAVLSALADPLSRLVAAGVWFQAGRASPAVLQLAVDTASAQGWSRPLLAWLQVQARHAELGGDPTEAARLRRRIDLVWRAKP